MYTFSDKTDNFDFLGQNLPKNGFRDQNFKNLSLDLESASLRYYVYQFSDKTDNFEFLGPNLPKNGFWGQNFENLSLDSELDTMCTNFWAQVCPKMDLGVGISKI